jgi:hypothetical protein
MFTVIEERYSNVTLQNDTRLISSIKISALMNSVRATFHFTDMTADMAFLSSEVLSLRLRKSVEHLKHSASQIAPQKQKSQADRSGERGGQKIRHKRRHFLEVR